VCWKLAETRVVRAERERRRKQKKGSKIAGRNGHAKDRLGPGQSARLERRESKGHLKRAGGGGNVDGGVSSAGITSRVMRESAEKAEGGVR